MTTIRILLLAASTSSALAGCTTSSGGIGSAFTSLQAPAVEMKDCREVAKSASLLSARAQILLNLPVRDVREGPSGSVILTWPDPKLVGASNEEIGAEMASVRQDAEAASCPVFFDPGGTDEPMRITPAPVGPVVSSTELPAPEQPVAAVPAVAEPVAAQPLPSPGSRPAANSAWSEEPVSAGVAGGNPALEPARPAAGKPAASKVAAATVETPKIDDRAAKPKTKPTNTEPKDSAAPAKVTEPRARKVRDVTVQPVPATNTPKAQPTP